MKILITGICGFAGSSLAHAWLEAAENLVIYGMDNLSRPGSELHRETMKKLGITLFHGDIRLASDFEMLPPVDWVIDAAANPSVLAGVDGVTSSRQLVEHNLIGTINILEYCKRNHAGFILLSTSRVYSIAALARVKVEPLGKSFQLKTDKNLPRGLSAQGICEDFSTAPPLSLYGSSKLASEVLAREYGAAFDFPVWINRCGVMAGAGQFGRPDQGIFAYWINSWRRRFPLKYIGFGGNGYQVRDCFHPRDLIPLLQKQTADATSEKTDIVNVGGGLKNSFSLAELSDWCADRFGPHVVESVPEIREYDVPWVVMDHSKATSVWGWQPAVSVRDILHEIARHAEQNPDWLRISGVV